MPSALYPEDELFTIVRLYRIYQNNLSNPMSLDLFYGWGRQMIADFTNIDASMPASEIPNFFANTIAAHELNEWHLDPEIEERLRQLIKPTTNSQEPIANDSVKEQYKLLWHQLYELYKGLRAEMEAEHKGYPACGNGH